MHSKPYQSIRIEECQEPLVAIPDRPFGFTRPHAYVVLGAPYGPHSPWMLRRSVLVALLAAQGELERRRPGWRLKLFDAYRPIAVQAFMVWREFQNQAALAGRSLAGCGSLAQLREDDPTLYEMLAGTIFEFWSLPSDDPLTPPPHSTGAAIDLTLEDATGKELDMGCPIDETTERAYPDHYASAAAPPLRAFHERRELLNAAMSAAGFSRHGNEWWHFSLGDQLWAWSRGQPAAIYGRAEPQASVER
jgi:D-alanyl-D-alanine dipeptidase